MTPQRLTAAEVSKAATIKTLLRSAKMHDEWFFPLPIPATHPPHAGPHLQ